MKSIILSKTHKNKYIGIYRVLSYCGLNPVFAESSFEDKYYDIIISDETLKEFGKSVSRHGGILITPDDVSINYSMDVLQVKKEEKGLGCDIAYLGDWGDEARLIVPKLSDVNNIFSFKLFGPPKMSQLNDYFWDFSSNVVASNTKISLITSDSPIEFLWDSIFFEKVILTTSREVSKLNDKIIYVSCQDELNVDNILKNYEHFHNIAKRIKEEMYVSNTYFSEVAKMFHAIKDDLMKQTLIETVKIHYEKNRNYNRQPNKISD